MASLVSHHAVSTHLASGAYLVNVSALLLLRLLLLGLHSVTGSTQ
jgi:hypothetical protein